MKQQRSEMAVWDLVNECFYIVESIMRGRLVESSR